MPLRHLYLELNGVEAREGPPSQSPLLWRESKSRGPRRLPAQSPVIPGLSMARVDGGWGTRGDLLRPSAGLSKCPI